MPPGAAGDALTHPEPPHDVGGFECRIESEPATAGTCPPGDTSGRADQRPGGADITRAGRKRGGDRCRYRTEVNARMFFELPFDEPGRRIVTGVVPFLPITVASASRRIITQPELPPFNSLEA